MFVAYLPGEGHCTEGFMWLFGISYYLCFFTDMKMKTKIRELEWPAECHLDELHVRGLSMISVMSFYLALRSVSNALAVISQHFHMSCSMLPF